MTAHVQKPRKKTAVQMAAKLQISPRQVRRYVAETRDQYEARADERRRKALSLREAGHTFEEIGATLGTSANAAKCLARRARRLSE